ncbi:hypothetical protein [Cupriavidus basilensis]|nr:hypothetical protein [Cupriavidus basilensis]
MQDKDVVDRVAEVVKDQDSQSLCHTAPRCKRGKVRLMADGPLRSGVFAAALCVSAKTVST